MILFQQRASLMIRLILASIAAIALLLVAIQVALYQYSTAEYLQHNLGKMLAEESQVSFSPKIKRKLWPRPTVILKDVVLSHQNQQVMQADEVHIGLAWKNLIGQREVEKLLLKDVRGVSLQQNDGHWNIENWLSQSDENEWLLNRVILQNTHLEIQSDWGAWHLRHLNWKSTRKNNAYDYAWQTQVGDEQQTLYTEGKGQLQKQENGWHSPDLKIFFKTQNIPSTFSGSLNAHAGWKEGIAYADGLQLEMKNTEQNAHADVQIARLEHDGEILKIREVQGILNAQNLDAVRVSASFNMASGQWQEGVFHSPQISLRGSTQDKQGNHTDFTLDSVAQYDGIWKFPTLQLMTLQTALEGHNRWAVEAEGALEWHNPQYWQLAMKGLLDRQPFNISLAQNEQSKAGSIHLSKWDLTPYLTENATEQHGQFLQNQLRDQNIELQIRIDALTLPTMTVENIQTTILAEQQQIKAEPFFANLYDGTVEGNATLQLTHPMQIQLQQKAKGVQILPFFQDLFRRGMVEGKGDVFLDFYSKGSSREEWLENLSGNMQVKVKNGFWLDIDINDILNRTVFNQSQNQNKTHRQATPFEHFRVESHIQEGVANYELSGKLSLPEVNFQGQGQASLGDGQMKLDLDLYSNAGKNRLPIRISGHVNQLSTSLNYQAMIGDADSAQEKQQVLSEALRNQWNWLRQGAKTSK